MVQNDIDNMLRSAPSSVASIRSGQDIRETVQPQILQEITEAWRNKCRSMPNSNGMVPM